MVYRDTSQNLTHFTIVYAGPPRVGKTASIRALSQELRHEQAVYTPQEHQGRTLYFDWLEYVGGLFMGDPLRCQIVSVPGQQALGERRRQLLQQADAVIFVADSSDDGRLARCKPYFDETQAVLAARRFPPGMVVQCNKQDVSRALSVAAVREALHIPETVNAYAASATDNNGIRQCFLLAVRLAIERAQALLNAGEELADNRPYRDGGELLQALRDKEPVWQEQAFNIERILAATPAGAPAGSVDLAGTASLDAVPASTEPAQPQPPRRQQPPPAAVIPVPGAFKRLVWPAVSGRSLLYRLAEVTLPEHARAVDDGWRVDVDGWCLYSRNDLVYTNEHHARVSLFHIGRGLLGVENLIGSNRCFALSAANGEVRIWEIIAPVPVYFRPLKNALHEAEDSTLPALQSSLHTLARQLATVDCLDSLAVDGLHVYTPHVRLTQPLLPALQTTLNTHYSARQWLQDWRQQLSAAGSQALAAWITDD